jgi:hypothetical protein
LGRPIKAGTIDVSVEIRIVDSTDGTPETGVVAATAGLVLQYRREFSANVALSPVNLAADTTAHTDHGIRHIGNGYYRVDLPDAACAAGQRGVLVHGTVTGMVVIGERIDLVGYDPYDGANLGLTTLANTATLAQISTQLQTTALPESYAADGAVPTQNQILYMIWSALSQFAVGGTTITCRRVDGTTTAMTFTMDSSTNPTSRTRTS